MATEVIPKNDFRVEGDVVWMALTQGKKTCVDFADWLRVCKFRWHTSKENCQIFYARTNLGKCKRGVRLHRLLVGQNGLEIDHENRDGLDNRRQNLRVATHGENMQNRDVSQSSVSGFKGVDGRKNGTWRARLTVERRTIHGGYFKDSVSAARRYDELALEHHGKFARLNFPDTQVALN
jgi:hypothetical protein